MRLNRMEVCCCRKNSRAFVLSGSLCRITNISLSRNLSFFFYARIAHQMDKTNKTGNENTKRKHESDKIKTNLRKENDMKLKKERQKKTTIHAHSDRLDPF